MKLLFVFVLLAQSAAADPLNPRYHDCVTLIEADVEIGRIAAQQWVLEGGGAMAQHCLAVADLAAGYPKLAAARLEELARREDAKSPEISARLYTQAAEAWLEAALYKRAEKAIARAFKSAPNAGELHLVAAKIYQAQDKPLKVIKAVNAAEEVDLGSAAGFVARGRAYHKTGDNEAAASDVVRALSIDPLNIDALVLRGDLRQAGVVIDVEYLPQDK